MTGGCDGTSLLCRDDEGTTFIAGKPYHWHRGGHGELELKRGYGKGDPMRPLMEARAAYADWIGTH